MSTSTNGAATVDPEPSTDAYAQALKAAEMSQTSEQRLTDTFRRQNVIQYAIIAILACAVAVLGFRKQVEVKLVYTDKTGAASYSGSAEDIANPTPVMVAHAAAQYITCLRTVSNDDLALDQCKQLVEDYMTQNVGNGRAHDDADRYYLTHNPKMLARTMVRSVINDRDHPIRVTRLGTSNTYYISWDEKLHDFARGDSYTSHADSLVISPPSIPTDDDMLRKNPTLFIVTQFPQNL